VGFRPSGPLGSGREVGRKAEVKAAVAPRMDVREFPIHEKRFFGTGGGRSIQDECASSRHRDAGRTFAHAGQCEHASGEGVPDRVIERLLVELLMGWPICCRWADPTTRSQVDGLLYLTHIM